MQKFIAYVASSIDGIISNNKTALPNWTSREDWGFLQHSLKAYDAFVMGYNTFFATKKLKRRPNTYVLTSRQLPSKLPEGIHFIDPRKTNLKQVLNNFNKIAVLGGSQCYQYMLDNNMLDEIYLTIEPVIIGSGIKMFAGLGKRLKLISIKKLNRRGTVLLHYKVSSD